MTRLACGHAVLPQAPSATMPRMCRLCRSLSVLPLALWLSACAMAGGPPPAPAPAAAPQSEPWPAGVRALLPALLDDAARRSGVAAARLRVATAQAVTWSDGALGCPQPGRMYTQALVPGWRVEIAVPGAAALRYHGSDRGGWVWCADGNAAPPAAPEQRR